MGSSAYATSPGSSAPSTARIPTAGGARAGGTGHGPLSTQPSERRNTSSSGGGDGGGGGDQSRSDRFDDRPRTSPERPAGVPPVPIAEMSSKNKPPLGPGSSSRGGERERGGGRSDEEQRRSHHHQQQRARSSSRDKNRDRDRDRDRDRAPSGSRGGGKENRDRDNDNRSHRSTHRSSRSRRHPEDYDSDDLSPLSDSEEESQSHRRARRKGETRKNSSRRGYEASSTYRSRRESDSESLSDGLSTGRPNRGGGDGSTTNRIHSGFDGKIEYKTLANEVVGYANKMEGPDGKKHRQEDLPIRLAFEHLSSLSGMSQKVQDAINQSRNLFQRKVDKMEQGLLLKAWRGWLLVQLGFVKKKNILKRAINKMRRRKLYLTFSRWSEVYTKKKKGGTLYQSVCTVVRNGRKRRTFQAWREKRADTRRRLLMVEQARRLHEDFMAALVKKGLRQVMHKRIRQAWNAFDRFSAERRAKRNKMRKVIGRALHGQQSRAFQRWTHWSASLRKQRGQLKRAVMRMLKAKLARGFAKWKGVMLAKKEKDRKMKRVLMKVLKRQQAMAFAKWWENIVLLRKAKLFMARMQRRKLLAPFNGWWDRTDMLQRQRNQCMKILGRIMHRVKAKAWAQWMRELEAASGCSPEQVKALRDENARLRRDNERFVRLVDSGEWGRGRVEELTEAGRVLREERRQLEDLIRSIKAEKDGIVKDRELQALETRGLKDRLVSGNFVQRNKMTVRGGSAFNSLQRALKQDLLDSGAAERNPEALQAVYAVDRLALDRVTVFPDGELNIQAVATDVEPFTRSAMGTKPLVGHQHGHHHGHRHHHGGGGERQSGRGAAAPRAASARYASESGGGMGGDSRGAGSSGAAAAQPALVQALSSLSSEEVDTLEEILRRGRLESQSAAAGAGGSSRRRPGSAIH